MISSRRELKRHLGPLLPKFIHPRMLLGGQNLNRIKVPVRSSWHLRTRLRRSSVASLYLSFHVQLVGALELRAE